MDNRPIGFLDSGVGGLTVVRQLLCRLPNEEVVYIADTARMPYGPHSPEEILSFTWDMVNFLLSKDVKMIVFACNTATAVALEKIQDQLDVPLVGIIIPGAQAALEHAGAGRIGVIATEATVKSESYQKAISSLGFSQKLQALACPPFVPLVESGNYKNQQALEIVRETLGPILGKVDILILGCTHYPLLAEQIQQVMGNEVLLVDSGAATIDSLSVLLESLDLARKGTETAQHQYFTTASATAFKKIAENVLEREVNVTSVNIESLGKNKILIASRNLGKVNEFRKMFHELGYEIESLLDHPDLPEIEETGQTFEENARLKAETISKIKGQLVIADDSGLCVDALNGGPGIFSHRFSGPDATDQMNNEKLLEELSFTAVKSEDRAAHFHCTLVVAKPACESLVIEADWFGHIALEPRGESGFGYDPLFLIDGQDKTAAELSAEEKNTISHRGQALKKLMTAFPAWMEEN